MNSDSIAERHDPVRGGDDATAAARVLLVDDHEENLTALVAILEDLGHTLVLARSGREALRHLLQEEFALVILDVQMPEMDGFETATLIRERERLQHLPIVFLTAMDKSETSLFKGYSVGAIDYIFKPFSPEILRAKVGAFIEMYRRRQEVKRQADILALKNIELARTNRTIGGLYRELEGKNAELSTERDFITAVLETAATYVIVLSPDGRIVRCNRACHESLGIPERRLLGRHLCELMVDDSDVETVEQLIHRVGRGEYPLTHEAEWAALGGERRSVCWSCTGLRGGDGEVAFVIVTGVDITDRKRAEDEVRSLNRELERRVEERTAQLERANEELRGEIAERHRAEALLRESEARFRRIFESNMIGINFSDLDGSILEANDAFLAIVGYAREDLANGGIPWQQLTPQEYHAADERSIERLRETGVCPPYQKEYVRRDGTRIPILVGRARLEGEEERAVAFVLDLSDLKEAERQLQSAKEAAESANRAKDRFLAVLSHELRTPLTPILTTVHVLAEEPSLPEELREWVDIIRSNVELEARLIDDLLDLTRISQGKLSLNHERVDLHPLVERVLAMCRHDADAKRINVEVDLAADASTVEGDGARLQQILWNLIKNALKFTPPEGQVSIRSRNEGTRVVVTVQDNGIGIEPELLPRVFDAFEQGGETVTRSYGGLGLGLAISRTLATMHQGELAATSEGKDRGASFILDLPLSGVAAEQIEAEKGSLPNVSEGEGVTVLLVEDNNDTSQVMQHLLRRRGYEVLAAGSVGEAIALARANRYDLVISDIGLPDGSGLDLITALSAERSVPAIAMSGYGMEEDIRRSRDAGFDEHLTKPVAFDRLARTMQSLLRPVSE